MPIEVPEKTEFYMVDTIGEATEILSERDATVIAGGQSLLPVIRRGTLDERVVVDISHVDDHGEVTIDDDGLLLGGLATYHDILESEVPESPWAILSEATERIADRQVRNWGTIGGAIAYADPAYDLPPPMAVFDAQVRVTADGDTIEKYPLEEVYADPFETTLGQRELIVGVHHPPLPERTGAAFEKHAYRKGDKSLVNLAARLSAANDGTISEARLCVGCVVPKPTRLRELEAELVGTDLGDRDAQRAVAERVGEYIDPIPEAHASASYQTRLSENMILNTLRTASERVMGGDR